MDDCQVQASFAIEIAMDQALGASGVSGDRRWILPTEPDPYSWRFVCRSESVREIQHQLES
jgi:hypothetical protein